MSSDSYWADQRYQDAYFDMHGHFVGQEDYECSLCAEQDDA